MSILSPIGPAPAWADDSTFVVTSEASDDGSIAAFTDYERFTATLPEAANLAGPDTGTLPLSDLVVGVGATISADAETYYIPGVYVGLNGRDYERFYFDTTTARKAAAALLEAADLLDGEVAA